jgi:hypothetical protein
MMAEHRCDHGPTDSPVTRARVQRIAAAAIEHNETDVIAVLREAFDCPEKVEGLPRCPSLLMVMMATMLGDALPGGKLGEALSLHFRLEATLDEFRTEDPEG